MGRLRAAHARRDRQPPQPADRPSSLDGDDGTPTALALVGSDPLETKADYRRQLRLLTGGSGIAGRRVCVRRNPKAPLISTGCRAPDPSAAAVFWDAKKWANPRAHWSGRTTGPGRSQCRDRSSRERRVGRFGRELRRGRADALHSVTSHMFSTSSSIAGFASRWLATIST